MATVTLQLLKDQENSAGLCRVYLVYNNNKIDCKLPTGKSVSIIHWNGLPDKPISKQHPEHESLNLILLGLKADTIRLMNDFYLRQDPRRYPTREEMRNLFNVKTGKGAPVDQSFFGLFDKFMNYQHKEKGGKNVTYGVYKNYKKIKRKLIAYQEFIKKPLTFASIDKDFAAQFTSFLKKEYNNSINTQGSYIKIVKTFTNWCSIHHAINISPLAKENMLVAQEKKWYTTLNMADLTLLASKDFSMAPIYQKTRDAFILQCTLGCRHQDLMKMMRQNISKEGAEYFIQMKSRKTMKLLGVPVPPLGVNILRQYENLDPKEWVPNNVKYNKYIKLVCKEAGLNEEVIVTSGERDNLREEVHKKYELITSHTARRTFINIMLRSGIADIDIAAITGQSVVTLQRYKHADPTQVKESIRKAWGVNREAD